jgi:hypothetical protein
MATAPYACDGCGSQQMTPRTMRANTPEAFVRWFCDCGASSPESILLKRRAKYGDPSNDPFFADFGLVVS